MANHVDDFYKMLENPGVAVFKIKYSQNQFDSAFESIGICYFIGSGEYFYQSNMKKHKKYNQLTKPYIYSTLLSL